MKQGHTGRGVALSGDGTTLAVGAPHEAAGPKGVNGNQRDNSVFDAGAVYVYTRTGSGWTQQAYIKASNPQMSAGFGHFVALSDDGNTLAVSAYWESSNAKGINGNQQDESIPQAGAVYVFTRQARRGRSRRTSRRPTPARPGTADAFGEGDQFGFSLALSGDGATLAVGALTEDGGATGINGNQADNSAASAGAVYVFTRTGRAWSQQAYVKPSNIDAGDLFGYAVALSRDGSVLAVGAFDEDGSARQVNGPPDNRADGSGAAYVFTRAGATWSQQAYIKPSNSEAQDAFGVDVALSDDGAHAARRLAGRGLPGDRRQPARLRQRLARRPVDGRRLRVRAQRHDWSQQAFLKSSNTGPQRLVRARLALSGDGNVAAIGASVEDGGAKGINGRNDDAAIEAGAVYLFTRTGTTWRQRGLHQGREHRGLRRVRRLGDPRSHRTPARGGRARRRQRDGRQPADKSADEAGAVYVFALTR